MLCQTWKTRQILHCLCLKEAYNLVISHKMTGNSFVCGTNTYQLPTMCQAHMLSARQRVVSKSLYYRLQDLMKLTVCLAITSALKITRIRREPCRPPPQSPWVGLFCNNVLSFFVDSKFIPSLRNITLWLGRDYCILNFIKINALGKK